MQWKKVNENMATLGTNLPPCPECPEGTCHVNLWRSDCPRIRARVAEVIPQVFDFANGNRPIPGAMMTAAP